jgi:spore germination protein
MKIYTVQSGDTVYQIAQSEGVTPEWLIAVNDLENPEQLSVGETLVIPHYTETYTVKEGDTLYRIANLFSTTVRRLYQLNPQLQGSPDIYPGESLVLAYDDQPTETISVNGYAYPFIDEEVLRRTLPYLTYLTVFAYGFDENGTLIIPDDALLLNAAKEAGVSPILLLSTLSADGVFNNALSNRLLNDPALQETLIRQLKEVVMQKGYDGVDIDFEYIFPQDAQKYVDFVRRVQEEMAQIGVFTVVSLAPKTSADQRGLLYEGHSYEGLGSVADAAAIMAYEWGYTFGPPMAIAPLNKVEDVLDYATTAINRNKIWLGTPNYAYDFTLPYLQGLSRARSLSNVQAVQEAFDKNAAIQYDAEMQAPYYTYYDREGKEHQVWFEDARSVKATLDLASEKGISTISIWNIMRYFPQLFAVLASEYNIATADRQR